MFIEFEGIKIQLIILLIYPAGIISAKIIIHYFESNPYFYLFIFFISHYLILFIKLFYKLKDSRKTIKAVPDISNISNESPNDEEMKDIKSKTIKQIDTLMTLELNSQINLKENEKINSNKSRNIKKEKILRIFYIGILYFIVYGFFYFSNYINTTDFYGNISMISEILYFSLFNKLIFKNKIYSHHLFSMILITISILALYIILIINFIENKEFNFLKNILYPTLWNFIAYLIFCYHINNYVY